MSDYLTDFVQESEERITELNNALLTLERDPTDGDAMESIFRVAHTLKSNCGAMGLDSASDLAHAIEDLLDAVRTGDLEVTPELMDVIFDAVDELETMIDEVAAEGEIETDPSATIDALRDQLDDEAEPGTVTTPTTAEIDAVLERFEPPADDEHEAYMARLAIAEREDVNNGTLVVKALIDAFDLIGTEPTRGEIDAGDYGGRFDAVFGSAVGEAAIRSGLEPVEEVADFELVNVSDRFDAVAGAAAARATESTVEPGDGISSEEAQDLDVDELLDEFSEFDDLDEMVEDVDDSDLDAFDEMGDAGSFDDLLGGAESDSDEQAAEAEAEAEADAAETDASQTVASTVSADENDVDDASAVFNELKNEVEMVGFDELQEELDELEFDEFDSDDEVGMDELIGDDVDIDDDSFLESPEPTDDELDELLVDETDDLADADEIAGDAGDPALDTDDAVDETDDLIDDAAGDELDDVLFGSDDGLADEPVAEATDAETEPETEAAVDETPAADPETAAFDAVEAAISDLEAETEAETEPAVGDDTESDDPTAAEAEESDDLESATEPKFDLDSDDAFDIEAEARNEAVSADETPESTTTTAVDESAGSDETTAAETDAEGDGDATPDEPDDTDEPIETIELVESTETDDGDESAEAVESVENDETLETEIDEADETDEIAADTDSEALEAGADAASAAENEETDDDPVDAADGETALESDAEFGSAPEAEFDPTASFADDADDAFADDETDESFAGDFDDAFGDETFADEFAADDAFDEDDFTDNAFDEDLDGAFDEFDDETFTDEFAVDDEFDSSASAETADVSFDEEEFGTDAADDANDDGEADVVRRIDEPTFGIPDITLPETDERPDADDQTDEVQSVRVDVDQIDSLLTLVEGLVTSRVRLRHAVTEGEDVSALEKELDGLEDLTTDLQETVMDVRLVPLQTVTNRLPRVVRDISREQDKDVAFEITGEDVELDRSILDRIGDPLIHLVRNAVDHGIEPPEDREASDKDPQGAVEVHADRSRDRVTITVEDDGAGLDPGRLRSEAVDADVLTEDEAATLSDDEAYELIFHPGLSTAEEVTDVSGRGVGMDVVKRTIDDLEGTVSIDSDPGEGTTVTMTLPVSVAIDDILFLECGGEEFGIPTKAVLDIEPTDRLEAVDGELTLGDDADEYSVVRLDDALETPRPGANGDGMLVRIRDDVRPVALHCDHVHGQQEVVVKPFEGFMSDIPGLSGATVRGRGEVVNILDVTTL